MNEWQQFRTVAVLIVTALLSTVGIGILVILREVTKDNSFGIDGIIETLKSIDSGLVGGLIAMTKQSPVIVSAAGNPPAAVPAAGPPAKP